MVDAEDRRSPDLRTASQARPGRARRMPAITSPARSAPRPLLPLGKLFGCFGIDIPFARGFKSHSPTLYPKGGANLSDGALA